MEYAKAKMEKILLLVLKIVDVTMMAHANQNEVKLLYRAQMIVNHRLVMKMAHVREKTVRMKPTVPTTAIHHLNVIIMEYAILENIGLRAATVHHAP
jgi:translation initiation factor 2 gamma subunit (eIF-2gamma)